MRLRHLPLPLLFLLGAACAAPVPAAPPAPPPTASAPQPTAQPGSAPPATRAPQQTPSSTPGAPADAAGTRTSAEPASAASVNDLTITLLRALEGEKSNVFFSATSLRTALGMTALGARAKTLEEMSRVLYLNPDPAQNAADAKREADEWKRAAGKAQLHIANRLFVQRGFALAPSFAAQTQSGYGASAGLVDFVNQAEKVRLEINRWVSDRTQQRIPNLLPQGSLGADTRMVLTNAIYFKGTWLEKFDKAFTRDEPFHTPSGTLSVPTMHRTATMSYGGDDDVNVLELPYKDSDLSMLIVLPPEPTTLTEVVQSLTPEKLEAWTSSLQPRKVSLALPKLEYSWGGSVKGQLVTLGIREAFGDRADFGAMSASGAEALYIDDVFHKGFVLVDESGTEAAAATGVVMNLKSLSHPIAMNVDRPFLFFIRNAKSGDVLFAGRVLNPKEKG